MYIKCNRPLIFTGRCLMVEPAKPAKREGVKFKPEFAKPGRPEVIKKILVVDDNSAVLEATLEYLSFKCQNCQNRAVDPKLPIRPQVISLVNDLCPDLIVLDGSMPGVTGEELTRELRDPSGRNFPGYILANTDRYRMRDAMLLAGADFWVPEKLLASYLDRVLV
jgi:CheY-like chemotaxis protein